MAGGALPALVVAVVLAIVLVRKERAKCAALKQELAKAEHLIVFYRFALEFKMQLLSILIIIYVQITRCMEEHITPVIKDFIPEHMTDYASEFLSAHSDSVYLTIIWVGFSQVLERDRHVKLISSQQLESSCPCVVGVFFKICVYLFVYSFISFILLHNKETCRRSAKSDTAE